MPTVIPFPVDKVRAIARSLLISSASRTTLSRPTQYATAPDPPEAFGNTLQRLITYGHGATVQLLQSVARELVEMIESGEADRILADAFAQAAPREDTGA